MHAIVYTYSYIIIVVLNVLWISILFLWYRARGCHPYNIYTTICKCGKMVDRKFLMWYYIGVLILGIAAEILLNPTNLTKKIPGGLTVDHEECFNLTIDFYFDCGRGL